MGWKESGPLLLFNPLLLSSPVTPIGGALSDTTVCIFHIFFCVPYKVNIHMNAGEFFLCFFLFHEKLMFPCMQGDVNKSNIRNIFVGYKLKFTFQTKPLVGFVTLYIATVMSAPQ